MRLFISISFILIVFSQVFADEMGGLVIDSTKTRLGRDFYEYFYMYYQEEPLPPDLKERTNIVIDEFTDPVWGTKIFVRVGDTVVYSANIKPKDVEFVAEEAVSVVVSYLLDMEKYERFLEEEIR